MRVIWKDSHWLHQLLGLSIDYGYVNKAQMGF